MLMAIWFHDIIYDPTASEKGKNERDSEELFQKLAKQEMDQIDDSISSQVSSLILATIDHKVPESNSSPLTALFLDLDLSVLGWKSEEYTTYSQMVRFEYQHVPDDLYLKGRKAVLQSLGEGETIFFTDQFRSGFEEQARANLQWEI